jgi:hypothetical protein
MASATLRTLGLALVAAALSAAAALANDSSAELAVGGLIFVPNDDVEMRAEDLYISAREVRVRYRFFNKSDKDVTVLVAFPMPDVTIAHQNENISVPTENAENILDFSTVVNGRPVKTSVEQRVFAVGIDRTQLLRSLGIPLAPHLRSTNDALDRLSAERWDELLRLGLAEIEEYDDGKGMKKHLSARWTLRTTYYWEQTFPAKREIAIEHRYQPSVGGTAGTIYSSPAGEKNPIFAQYRTKYCVDKNFLAAIERAKRAAKLDYAPFMEQRIEYILKTGANWSGPIGDFRLVVDKGDASSLVSFCGEGVKRISETQFEMRAKNFTPEGNLSILILTKPPAN